MRGEGIYWQGISFLSPKLLLKIGEKSMPTFDEFCKEKNLGADIKDRFLDYISDGDLINYNDATSGENLDEENLKTELKDFERDYPDLFEGTEVDEESGDEDDLVDEDLDDDEDEDEED